MTARGRLVKHRLSGSVYIGRAVHPYPYKNHHPSSALCNFNTGITLPPKSFERPHSPLIFTNSCLLLPSPGLCSQVCLAPPSTSLNDLSLANLPCPRLQCVCNFLKFTAVSNYRSRTAPTEACHSWRRYARRSATLTPSEEQNPQVLAARHHYFVPLLLENFPKNM